MAHIELWGSSEYRNTHGYLNAELRPFLGFYPILAVVFMVLLVYWLIKMYQHKRHLITLHYFMLAVLIITIFQSLMMFKVFLASNEAGETKTELVFFSMILEVMRSTFTKVVTLLVGIGYEIHMPSIEPYQ